MGQNCPAGTYSPDGIMPCQNCGIGHYCTGAMTRTPCTYGAISCQGINHASDPAMPAGAPINKLMTLDEVNEFIPTTDATQWRKISCCASPQYTELTPGNPSALNYAKYACATGTIGPGTYLFITHYTNSSWTNSIDSITGNTGSKTSAIIAIFDHPVSYASMHGNSIFQHFIDIEHPTYTKWTFSTAPVNGNWNQPDTNETNILNIINLIELGWANLCVYELK